MNADSRRAALLRGRGPPPPQKQDVLSVGRVISDKMNKTSSGCHCGAELERIKPEPNSMSNNVSNGVHSANIAYNPADHSLLMVSYLYRSIYTSVFPSIEPYLAATNECFHYPQIYPVHSFI